MKFVFQLGDVPLYGLLVDKVTISEDQNWTVKQTQFQQTGGFMTHTPERRRIFDVPTISISARVKSTNTLTLLSASQKLRAVGGYKNIPLIVFEAYDNLSTSKIRWLYTPASVKSIKQSSEYIESDSGFYVRDIDIELTADYRWQPLNSQIWEFRPYSQYAKTPTAPYGPDNLFVLPTRLNEVRKDYYFYNWNQSLDLTPSLWPYLDDGYGQDYADFRSLYVLSSESFWGAAPESIYAFTNLLPQGEIKIIANDQISTLDLEDLNTQLVNRGLTGLQLTDEIFAGDTDPFSSFIYRSGSIISAFVPQWSTNSVSPGELQPGLNKITMKRNNTSGLAALRVKFRAL